ncbi:membrane protein involved in the export of O-antigen and teichoic acid [Burkholderiales bacterium JOSHI_001]|nr:membrane protein involved in the export of O-antigen and teichoic acid [Burkholderiales bacterium JOSHI_001]
MSLIRNAVYNFAGGIAPALSALLTVPVVIAHLGAAQYGVLVLVLSVVGYFSILDVNVTAGSTKYLAEHHARGDHDRVGQVLAFGSLLYLGIGLAGAAALVIYARPLAVQLFNIPLAAQPDAIRALQWAGAGFLCGQFQTYLQSVLHALQRFDLSGKSESVFGTVASLLTMFAVLMGGGLVAIVVARLLLNMVNIAWQLVVLRRLLPQVRMRMPGREVARAVAGFSAYSYLSRLANVSAANSDKLFVGALTDMRSLALYAVPFTLVNRVFSNVYRLAQVLFPAASAMAAQNRHQELRAAYIGSTRVVVFVNAALCLLLVSLAPELLHYWAGKDFGDLAVTVMVCVALAVFLDSLTNLPSILNDGLGHPRYTGMAAILRAATGIVLSYWAVRHYGILGAAVAQLLVSLVATVITLVFLHRVSLPVPLGDVIRHGFMPSVPVLALAGCLGWLAGQRSVVPPFAFFAAGVSLLLGLAVYGWLVVLPDAQRHRLVGMARARLRMT